MKFVKLLGLAVLAVIIFMVLWGFNVINAAFFENLNPFSEKPPATYEAIVTPAGAGMPAPKPRANLGAELLARTARAGVPEAQYDVGTDLYYGADGVEKDIAESVNWFRAAAEKEFPQSIIALAHIIREPQIKAKTRAKQLKWISAQADAGNGEASFVIGRFYEYGFLGFETDADMAASWYERALAAGYQDAAIKLTPAAPAQPSETQEKEPFDLSQAKFDFGHLLEMFEDYQEEESAKAGKVPVSVEDAEALLVRADDLSMAERSQLLKMLNAMRQSRVLILADKGYADALNQAGLNAYNGSAGAERDAFKALTLFWEAATAGHDMGYQNLGAALSHRDISEAQRQPALSWLAQQSDKGHARAQDVMGNIRRYGQFGYEKDSEMATILERKAAEKGVVAAQADYGFALTIGDGVPKDEAEGVRWLTKAAQSNDASAQFWLAKAYQRGEGIEKDHFKAIDWFEQAFARGYSGADLSLVQICSDMDSPARNDGKAMAYAEHMVKENNSHVAHEYIGDFYKAGRHYPQSDVKAAEHYRIAADQNLGSSQFKLAAMYLDGRGVAQDRDAAIELMKKAAGNYSVKAQFKLKDMGIDYEKP